MTRAIDAASAEPGAPNDYAARTMMALRVMLAVGAGEENPERLKVIALNAIDGRSASPSFRSLGTTVTRSNGSRRGVQVKHRGLAFKRFWEI